MAATGTVDKREARRARIEAEERALDQKERLEERLPGLIEAWGDTDPVVTLVRAAIADDARPALANAAVTAIDGRLAAEAELGEGSEFVSVVRPRSFWDHNSDFDLAERYSIPVNEPTSSLGGLMPVIEADGGGAMLRAANLLNLLLQAGHPGDANSRLREARLLVEVPYSKATPDCPRVVGLGGYDITEEKYRTAVNRLRNVNAGSAGGPVFARVRIFPMTELNTDGTVTELIEGEIMTPSEKFLYCRQVPGGDVVRALLSLLEVDGHFDLSETFVVMEQGRVVGVGGWKERRIDAATEVPVTDCKRLMQ